MSDVEELDGQQGDGQRNGSVLADVSNALVSLHKEQFGRGPTRARSGFTTENTLVCTLEDALLPAERALVDLGQQIRVQESRLFFQTATRDKFITVVEGLVGRKVRAFSSATDPDAAMVWEIFHFKSREGDAT
jgi:uncharacterized protein YbcI